MLPDPLLFPAAYGAYVAALLGLWAGIGTSRRVRDRMRRSRGHGAVPSKDTASGHMEPVSLHPAVDTGLCIGCGACTHACPEGQVLTLTGGKAGLSDPASCIGHGACKTACPVGAIELVFGSARRGIDIPLVSSEFESSVPGVFIAGELGGMGLIANAVEQGRQVINAIAARRGRKVANALDVVIVGAGPAGIAATLAAKEQGLAALTVEQDTMGGTVAHYPRGKIVMTRPAFLPLYGKVRLRHARKERLLALWSNVLVASGATIHYGIRVERVERHDDIFRIVTSDGICMARHVLLASGRRGAPKRLGVPGEDQKKVAYRLADARQYSGRHVAVVGGGDSALEAALELARHPVASVTLICRGSTPARARASLRSQLEAARRSGRICAMMDSDVAEIHQDRIFVLSRGRVEVFANDAVIVAIGGTLPIELLSSLGVSIERKYGTA